MLFFLLFVLFFGLSLSYLCVCVFFVFLYFPIGIKTVEYLTFCHLIIYWDKHLPISFVLFIIIPNTCYKWLVTEATFVTLDFRPWIIDAHTNDQRANKGLC